MRFTISKRCADGIGQKNAQEEFRKVVDYLREDLGFQIEEQYLRKEAAEEWE